MLTYRSYVHSLAMSASAEATTLALLLAGLVPYKKSPEYNDRVSEAMPSLIGAAGSLREAIDKLLSALPTELEGNDRGDRGLHRHLYWINRRLTEGIPTACVQDPIDIAGADLPSVLERFERWYEKQARFDGNLENRLRPLIAAGQLNSALREAWAIFKTRMVGTLGVSEDLDGHQLADALFGSNGPLVNLLTETDRKGYLSLFKGLYTLYRNPVAHNDIQPNPEEVDAVLMLVNAALVKIGRAQTDSKCAIGVSVRSKSGAGD